MNRLIAAFFIWGTSVSTAAGAPKVVADIAPVWSLVSTVMKGVGSPVLLVPPGADPHNHSLRPSDAQNLQDADAVFWVGAGLSPWLESSINALVPTGAAIAFTTNEQDHDHDHHHNHDPHAWLDPETGIAWLEMIAAVLGEVDATNAERFRSNAENAADRLRGILSSRVGNGEAIRYIAYHDAYGPLQRYANAEMAGAIAASDHAAPSVADLSALRDLIATENVTCIVTGATFNPGHLDAIFEDSERIHVVVDATGADLPLEPDLYFELISNAFAAFDQCREGG